MTIKIEYMTKSQHNTTKKIFIIMTMVLCITIIHLIIDQNRNIIQARNYNDTTQQQDMVEYTGEIEYLSFTTLIAFPEKIERQGNNNEKLTVEEFKELLEALYKNDYIVVDIDNIYKINEGQVHKQKLALPKNKKPVVLTFDNVSYKSSYQNRGEIDKIIIDRNNELASYTTKQSIQDRVQYDNEFILILENYLKEHPDFHLGNAKGIIFCTGENGILGYNTCHQYASSKQELKRVTNVINRLKNLGWKFGCNNYRYISQKELPELDFAKDLSLWLNETKLAIKETPLFAYPFGEIDNKNERMDLLLSNGFKIFFVNNSYVCDNNYRDYVIIKQNYINSKTYSEYIKSII